MKRTSLDKAVFFGGIGLLVFSCSLHGTPSAIVGLAGIVLCCYKWQACFGTKAERKAKKEAQKVQAEMEAAQEREEIRAAHNPVKAKIIVSNTSKKAGSAAIRTAIGSSIAGLPGTNKTPCAGLLVALCARGFVMHWLLLLLPPESFQGVPAAMQ